MKILIISQYFWPENFKINDLCLGLKEKGHHIEVLTGLPNYPKGRFFEGYSFSDNKDEIWNGIHIHRSKLLPRGSGSLKLMVNYFSFAFFASLKSWSIKNTFDCILVYEPSPITVGIPAIVAGKKFKIPYYFWVQDLWPESLTAAGGIQNKFVLKFFDKITKLIYKKAEKVLVQSRGFKDYIINQGIDEKKIIFYPNSTENFYQPLPSEQSFKDKMPEGFCIMFAGNLGEAQSLFTILKAAVLVKNKGYDKIKWVFIGDGRQKEQLKKYVSQNGLEKEVFFLGSYPGTDMPKFFSCSNALISTLKKDKIFSLTIPSKIQSYLACGRPILASLDGEGAEIINKAQAGYSSPAEDEVSLAENAIRLFNDSEEDRKLMGKNGLSYFNQEFERNMLLDKLINILDNKL